MAETFGSTLTHPALASYAKEDPGLIYRVRGVAHLPGLGDHMLSHAMPVTLAALPLPHGVSLPTHGQPLR